MNRLTRKLAPAPVADLAPYEADVAQALEAGFRWMRFPARLEQLFERETEHARSAHLVLIGILWTTLGIAVTLLLFRNRGGTPAPFGIHPAIRLGVITPFLVAVTFAIWWGVRPFVRELVMMLACIIAPASLIISVLLDPSTDLGTNRGSLTIILLFVTVVVRLRFWFAAIACFTLIGLQVVVPLAMGVPILGNGVLSLITIAATLAANYTLEREYRLNYLHRLRGRIQGAELSALVAQLHDLSNQDPLTGLANRRALDAVLDDLCSRRERFSVILLDVDAFKAFNDTYGHQIGDDALRRIAAMLRASLRFTSDRVARMGGEEFAVVLPQTALEDARTMAERMRNSILELRIPHIGSAVGKVVSISAGVSSSNGDMTPKEIIAAADKALYRAKLAGRNRVELARELEVVVVPVPATL